MTQLVVRRIADHMSTTRGRCLCGDVTFEVTGPFDLMSHCHCSRCRKLHGAAFATYALCRADDFRLTGGRERIGFYESSPGFERAFCTRCGSVVPDDAHPWDGKVFVPAGLLDDDPGARPQAHIFAGSKAPWYEIADGLPAFEAYPDGIPMTPVANLTDRGATEAPIAGSCLCGAVAYEASGDPVGCVYCHCSRCRKANAAAHAANIVLPAGGVRFLRGEQAIVRYALPGANVFAHHFCRTCSAAVPRAEGALGIDLIPMGSLDRLPPSLRPERHIFTGSKAAWYDIPGALPQHVEYPG